MRRLDKIANFAVIVGVAVFLMLVVRNEFGHRNIKGPNALLGKKINLPELQFPSQRGALILALSTGCHFCEESLPFYRALAAEVQGKADLVAVFPQTGSEGQAYLDRASVPVARVISSCGPTACAAYTCIGNFYCLANGDSYNPCVCYPNIPPCWEMCIDGQWKR